MMLEMLLFLLLRETPWQLMWDEQNVFYEEKISPETVIFKVLNFGSLDLNFIIPYQMNQIYSMLEKKVSPLMESVSLSLIRLQRGGSFPSDISGHADFSEGGIPLLTFLVMLTSARGEFPF